MPKIKITKLPKYILGGPPICPTGKMPDPNNPEECIDDPNYNPFQVNYKVPSAATLNDSDAPQMNEEEKKQLGKEKSQEKNRQNWLNKPQNEMSTYGWAQDFQDKFNLSPTYDPNKKYNKKGNEQKKTPFFGDMSKQEKVGWFEDMSRLGLAVGDVLATDKSNRDRKKAYDKNFRFNQFNPAAQGRDKGNWTADSQKTFQPNMQSPVNEGMMNRQYGGGIEEQSNPSTVKIKIVDGPEPFSMKYGGQFKGSYGFDVGWRNLYTDMAKTSSDHIGNTMSQKKNPDEDYVLEAEGGEVIYKPGDHTSHTITGPSHAEGGVKLTDGQVSSKTAPDVSSFIFSKTKALAIKDPEVLSHFGITNFNKGGVVPAKIAKMFEINKYKAIIEDPNKDDLSKRTAALMLDRNEKYLAELSVVQEGMKGKEAPEFAQTILGGEKAEAKFGGWVNKYKGLRKFVGGGSEDDPKTKKEDVDPWQKKEKTPTGQTNEYNMPPDYLQKWETKIPGISKMSNADAQTAIYDYMLKNHPEKVREMWKTYGLTTQGMGKTKLRRMTKLEKDKKTGKYVRTGVFEDVNKLTDEQLKELKDAYVDAKFGKRQMVLPDTTDTTTIPPDTTDTTTLPPGKITIETPPTEEPSEETPKFICIVDKETGYKVVNSPMGYDSYEEALANCGKTATPPPFDFPMPDKVAMAAAAIGFPRKDYPTIANKNYERGTYALNDWAAAADRAFNTQFLAPSRAMASYTAPQGLASNMLAASGQAADTIVGNVIPTITSQNVGIFNQFSAAEQQRKDAIDDYNAKAQIARDEGRARTEQMAQQELVDYAQRNAEQFAKSWIDRYKWYDQGFVNPNFYRDPRTGKPVYRNTGGYSGTGDDDGSDVGSLGSSYNAYYKKFYDDMSDIKDPKERAIAARNMAGKAVGAGRVSRSAKDPYDFYQGRTRSTSYDLPEQENDDDPEMINP